MKQIAGYFRCDGRDVPIYDGGNSIAPFAPYRAPGELRPLSPAVLRAEQRIEAQARLDAAYCTPRRYDSMTGRMWEDEETWEVIVPSQDEPEPLPEPRRTVQAPPAVVEPELPIPVTDWPTRPVEVEAEPVPVVVNWTAARFSSLELREEWVE